MSLKRFPLRTFFIWGNKKNLFRVNQVNREGEAQGSCHFWSKTGTLSAVWASVLVHHHHEWVTVLKESSKKILLKPNTASHNNASWYTDADGLVEHSPSRGSLYYKGHSLQKIIPGFLGPPLIYWMCKTKSTLTNLTIN